MAHPQSMMFPFSGMDYKNHPCSQQVPASVHSVDSESQYSLRSPQYNAAAIHSPPYRGGRSPIVGSGFAPRAPGVGMQVSRPRDIEHGNVLYNVEATLPPYYQGGRAPSVGSGFFPSAPGVGMQVSRPRDIERPDNVSVVMPDDSISVAPKKSRSIHSERALTKVPSEANLARSRRSRSKGSSVHSGFTLPIVAPGLFPHGPELLSPSPPLPAQFVLPAPGGQPGDQARVRSRRSAPSLKSKRSVTSQGFVPPPPVPSVPPFLQRPVNVAKSTSKIHKAKSSLALSQLPNPPPAFPSASAQRFPTDTTGVASVDLHGGRQIVVVVQPGATININSFSESRSNSPVTVDKVKKKSSLMAFLRKD